MISDALTIKNSVQSDANGKFLVGGLYQLVGHATWSAGSLKVQQQAPDGVTWLDTGVQLTADGVTTIYLPPATVRLVITTATAVYAALARVPLI